jgi:outer membrane receptor protein involved in Fe transport
VLLQNNNIVDNAGKTKNYGAELETNWFPTDYQSYTLAYGFTHTELKDYIDDEYAVLRCQEDCYDGTDASVRLREELGDVGGNQAPRTPEHNIAVSQTYQRPFLTSDFEWFVRNDLIYESKKYSTTSNLTYAPEQYTWNTRAGVDAENWTVSWYINNVTDEKSPLQIQDFPLFDLSKNYQDPAGTEVNSNSFQLLPRRSRNTGITAQYRFGAR